MPVEGFGMFRPGIFSTLKKQLLGLVLTEAVYLTCRVSEPSHFSMPGLSATMRYSLGCEGGNA